MATIDKLEDLVSNGVARNFKTTDVLDKWSNRVTVSKSLNVLSWRMVHDGKALVTVPFISVGVTGTKYVLFQSMTLAGCKDEIVRLGLTVTAGQKAEIDQLAEIKP